MPLPRWIPFCIAPNLTLANDAVGTAGYAAYHTKESDFSLATFHGKKELPDQRHRRSEPEERKYLPAEKTHREELCGSGKCFRCLQIYLLLRLGSSDAQPLSGKAKQRPQMLPDWKALGAFLDRTLFDISPDTQRHHL